MNDSQKMFEINCSVLWLCRKDCLIAKNLLRTRSIQHNVLQQTDTADFDLESILDSRTSGINHVEMKEVNIQSLEQVQLIIRETTRMSPLARKSLLFPWLNHLSDLLHGRASSVCNVTCSGVTTNASASSLVAQAIASATSHSWGFPDAALSCQSNTRDQAFISAACAYTKSFVTACFDAIASGASNPCELFAPKFPTSTTPARLSR